MNAIASSILATGNVNECLGWRPNLERLRQDYEAARLAGRPDPWAVVEAECWLDLIDAELSVPSTRAQPQVAAQLQAWQKEITAIAERLRALERRSPTRSEPSPARHWSNVGTVQMEGT